MDSAKNGTQELEKLHQLLFDNPNFIMIQLSNEFSIKRKYEESVFPEYNITRLNSNIPLFNSPEELLNKL